MSTFLRRGRNLNVPFGRPILDRFHPIGKMIISAYLPGSAARFQDLGPAGVTLSPQAACVVTPSRLGAGAKNTGANQSAFADTPASQQIQPPFSLFYLAESRGNRGADSAEFWSSSFSGGAAPYTAWSLGYNSGTNKPAIFVNVTSSWNATVGATDVPSEGIFSLTGTQDASNNQKLYLNGRLDASGGGAGGAILYSGPKTSIGVAFSAPTRFNNKIALACYLLRGTLPPDFSEWLHFDPFDMFRSDKRRFYYLPSGAIIVATSISPMSWRSDRAARELMPVDWPSIVSVARSMPIEWRKGYASGSSLLMSWLGTAASAQVSPNEWMSSIAPRQVFPTDWLIGVSTNGAPSPVSWSGNITSKSSSPISTVANVTVQMRAPIAFGGGVMAMDAQPFAWLADVGARTSNPISWGSSTLSVVSGELMPISWLSGTAANQSVAVAWTASLSARQIAPISWASTMVALVAESSLPISWSAGVAGVTTTPIGWSAVVSARQIMPICIDGSRVLGANYYLRMLRDDRTKRMLRDDRTLKMLRDM